MPQSGAQPVETRRKYRWLLTASFFDISANYLAYLLAPEIPASWGASYQEKMLKNSLPEQFDDPMGLLKINALIGVFVWQQVLSVVSSAIAILLLLRRLLRLSGLAGELERVPTMIFIMAWTLMFFPFTITLLLAGLVCFDDGRASGMPLGFKVSWAHCYRGRHGLRL